MELVMAINRDIGGKRERIKTFIAGMKFKPVHKRSYMTACIKLRLFEIGKISA
jgi:hypothetical protein